MVDLHKSLRSRAIVKQLGINTVSFEKLNFKKWLLTKLKLNRLPQIHLIDRYFNGLESIDVTNDGLGLEYYLNPKTDFNALPIKLPANNYVVFAIGGTYATKRLPIVKIIEIVNKIKGYCVLIGGPEDSDSANTISELVKTSMLVNLVGQLSLDESAIVIKNARHVISHDTGMMHIAAAFNKPLSVIWGNTHPILGMYPYGYNDNSKVFNHEVDIKCRPCSKLGYNNCPKAHFNCMNLQNVEEIVKNCNFMESTQ